MAIYHFRSTSAKARQGRASRHGSYIRREGVYAERKDLAHHEHGNMPTWAKENPDEFWKAADEVERSNGRAYREFEVALPRELDLNQQKELVRHYVREQLGERHAYEWAIHDKGDGNPHAHIQFSERTQDGIERDRTAYFKRSNPKNPERGGCKKQEGWNVGKGQTPEPLLDARSRWADLQNIHLDRAGKLARVDHRTLEAQGIARVAQIHVGYRDNQAPDVHAERHTRNEAIKVMNQEEAQARREVAASLKEIAEITATLKEITAREELKNFVLEGLEKIRREMAKEIKETIADASKSLSQAAEQEQAAQIAKATPAAPKPQAPQNTPPPMVQQQRPEEGLKAPTPAPEAKMSEGSGDITEGRQRVREMRGGLSSESIERGSTAQAPAPKENVQQHSQVKPERAFSEAAKPLAELVNQHQAFRAAREEIAGIQKTLAEKVELKQNEIKASTATIDTLRNRQEELSNKVFGKSRFKDDIAKLEQQMDREREKRGSANKDIDSLTVQAKLRTDAINDKVKEYGSVAHVKLRNEETKKITPQYAALKELGDKAVDEVLRQTFGSWAVVAKDMLENAWKEAQRQQKERQRQQEREAEKRKVPASTAERTYVHVPYEHRELAKQAGAHWDNKENCWYVDAKNPAKAVELADKVAKAIGRSLGQSRGQSRGR